MSAEDYDVEVFTHEALSQVYLLARPNSASDAALEGCKVFVSSDAGESFAAMPLPVQLSRECDLVVSESGIILTDVLTSTNSLVASWYTSATESWATQTFGPDHDPSLAGGYLADGDALNLGYPRLRCSLARRYRCEMCHSATLCRWKCRNLSRALRSARQPIGSRPRVFVAEGEVFLNALKVWRLLP